MSSVRPTVRRSAFALSIGLALATPSLPPRARKLSGPMPRASLGDVKDFQFVPGQDRVLYLADQDTDEVFELYSRELGPDGRSVRLHPPLLLHQDVDPGFQIDPTGSYVIFRYGSTTCSVPIDGSLPIQSGLFFGSFSPDGTRIVYSTSTLQVNGLRSTTPRNEDNVSLIGDFVATRDISGQVITPDSANVVFRADLVADDRFEVFRAPIDGSAPPVSISGSGAANRDVTSFRMNADGSEVVFRFDQDVAGKFELFRAPVDGSAGRERVTPPLALGRVIDDVYDITPNGVRVVFMGDVDAAGVHELFSVELGGPPVAVPLGPALAPGGQIRDDFQLSSDSRRVVYRADQEGDGTFALFSARLDGATPPLKIFVPGPGEEVGRFAIDADALRVVFLLAGSEQRLVSVPIDCVLPAVALHPPLVAGGDVSSFVLAGERAVYRADQDIDEVLELFSAPVDASAPAVRLHAPLAPGRAVLPDFRLSPGRSTVGFIADVVGDERFELFSAPVDGSARARLVSDPAATAPTPVGDVFQFVQAGERVVYQADEAEDGVFELFSVPRDGSDAPLRLHRPVQGGDVQSYHVAATPDGRRVVYHGDLQTDEKGELFSALVDGSAPPVKLNGPMVAGGDVVDWWLAADGARVVYLADAVRDEQLELFSVPTAGGAAVRLAPPPRRDVGDVFSAAITPDSRSVLFRSDTARRGQVELYVVPLDGSAPALQLSHVIASGGDVTSALCDAASTHAVFAADQDVNDLVELYGVPLDGSSAPVQLSPSAVPARDVGAFLIGAGGEVVFLVGNELMHAPLDGSAAAQSFFQTTSRAGPEFWLTPGGTRVLFLAEVGSNTLYELFSAPVDGSAAPAPLGAWFSSPQYILVLFPDEQSVVFHAPLQPSTWRVPLDGSAPPALLDTHVPRRLSADGKRLLLSGAEPFDAEPGLFVMRSDGSGPRVRIPPALRDGGHVSDCQFAGANAVLFTATLDRSEVVELYVSDLGLAPGRGEPQLPRSAPAR